MNRALKKLCVASLLLPAICAAQTTAITGATVHTVGPEGTLENATVLIDGGRISAVGTNVQIPPGAERVDASGKIITPGLITPLGQIGLTEVGAVAGTNDATQRGEAFAASFDVADAYNPRSTLIAINRIDGVTRAIITPRAGSPDSQGNSSHVLSGIGSAVQLGDSPEYFVRRGAVVVANFGESGGEVAGGSRAAAAMILRKALDDALDYRQNRAATLRGDWRDYSVSLADLDALQAVLNGATPLLFHVDRAADISVVLGIAAEYGIQAIIAGGAEAWMVADHLAAAGVPVILDGVDNLPGNFDRLNARLDSASRLLAAGVKVAFGAGAQTHNARNLTQSAGIAVANGVDWDAALRAITLAPAEIYGIDGTVGSLEPGKEADLVIWDADPLEITSYPDQVYIQGNPVAMESRQTLLRDRYLDPEDPRPPVYRQ